MILTVCLAATISAATAFARHKVLGIAVDNLSGTYIVIVAVVTHEHTGTGIRIDVVVIFETVLNGSTVITGSNAADNLTGVHYVAFHHIAVLNETLNQLASQSTVTTTVTIFPIITDNTQIAHSSGYSSEHTAGGISVIHCCGKAGNGKALSVKLSGKASVGNGLAGMVKFVGIGHTDGDITFNTAHVNMIGKTHLHLAEETAVHTF